MIVDQYNRVHDYLRISLTDQCNLRCLYCMPENDYAMTPPHRLMQANEIALLAETFVQLGVKKIRLTGGEPLVRKDAAAIIRALGQLPVQLALTTNGTRLHLFAPVLEEAGVQAVNISLDSLRTEKFKWITKRDQFARVQDNIQGMLRKGVHVKINVVVMQDVNEDEINDFIAWTKDEPIHIRFIEFMPFTGNGWTGNKVVTWAAMQQIIQSQYDFIPLQNDVHDTARTYQVPGHAGTFSIISTMSSAFCGQCNRMRLTADGKMKNCLFSKEETDLLSALRRQEPIEPLIHQCIRAKAKALGGQFTNAFENLEAASLHNRSMISIGG